MLGSTLQLRPGLTLHKVALDWGQPKLLYVKPISSPLGLSCFYIFYEYSFGEIFLQNFIFWPKKMFDKIFLRQFFSVKIVLQNFLAKIFWGQTFLGENFVYFFCEIFTNVTVTVGICSRWSHEPTIKAWSKSGQ